jgi:TPR repeat protein
VRHDTSKCVLAHTYAEPGHRYANPVALARAHRRRGSDDVARRHLEECGTTLSEPALLELASLYARSRQWKEAIALWEPLAARGVIEATERLAKYAEHVRRDPETALRYAEVLVSRDGPRHEHRLQRLQRKVLAPACRSPNSEVAS